MFKFNLNWKLRDNYLGIEKEDYDIAYFNNIDCETLKYLIDDYFINPAEKQNESPSVQEFYDFMVKYPEIKAHGYAVNVLRDDYRISIEGLKCETNNKEIKEAFKKLCKNADELKLTKKLYSWWD
jgi:hypothetical protein